MTAPGVAIEIFGGDEARALCGVVSDMYRAVFSLPPFSGDDAEFANQRSTFPGFGARAGFRLAMARAGEAYAGFGYGFLLSADTNWRTGLAAPVSPEFAREDGHRTFALMSMIASADRSAVTWLVLPLSAAIFYNRPGIIHVPAGDLAPSRVCVASDSSRRSALIREYVAIVLGS